ncbi:MAG: hypothetical protein J6A04_01950 [Clostridia bacterium]|nr:hypothetical protein [Clostridia bacterium]
MNSNQSYSKLNKTEYLEKTSHFFTLEELQILLSERGVCEGLYTHPVVVSLLGKLLPKCNHLSLFQISQLLDDIISVSITNRSFSIVFHKPYNEKIFSYKLEDNKLIYTKQTFVKDTCTVLTRYFDLNGKKICELDHDVYKIDQITSNHCTYYPQKQEEDYSR